jgi:hypothetical protein
VAQLVREVGGVDHELDVLECQTYRPQLEAAGMRFAPVEVACRFGVEWRGDEWAQVTDDQTFGFHGVISEYGRRYAGE